MRLNKNGNAYLVRDILARRDFDALTSDMLDNLNAGEMFAVLLDTDWETLVELHKTISAQPEHLLNGRTFEVREKSDIFREAFAAPLSVLLLETLDIKMNRFLDPERMANLQSAVEEHVAKGNGDVDDIVRKTERMNIALEKGDLVEFKRIFEDIEERFGLKRCEANSGIEI